MSIADELRKLAEAHGNDEAANILGACAIEIDILAHENAVRLTALQAVLMEDVLSPETLERVRAAIESPNELDVERGPGRRH